MPDAYERLLMDVIKGNPTLFMRRDEVEAAWTVDRADPRALGGHARSGPSATRPARPDRPPPPRSSSVTAEPGRSPTSDPTQNGIHPTLADVTERHRRAQRATAAPSTSRRIARPPTSRPGPRAARLRQPRARLRRVREPPSKQALRGRAKPNIAIVSVYNDMLSAHQPYATTRAVLKKAVIRAGGIAQFAGGVPAMCDGITQGRDGMQLSLYSRDVIAMSTAIALSHDMFDGALMLGVCDKIMPGLLIGALSFGHLPTVFVPAGPMASGLPNAEKARIRQLYAEGKVGRDELLEAEAASYHSAGTCTFYGTANSNQLLMEVLGLHLPGSSFVNPGTPLREALTRAAGRRVTEMTARAASPRRSARSSTRRRSSTPASRCSPAAARPTTRCTWSRSPGPRASR